VPRADIQAGNKLGSDSSCGSNANHPGMDRRKNWTKPPAASRFWEPMFNVSSWPKARIENLRGSPRPPGEMATWSPLVVEWNATGGRALLRLLCPRHCVGRFSDHTLASDAHLHTCGAGTRGLIIVPYTPRHGRRPQRRRSGLSTIHPPVLNDSNWPISAV
jgi:hypothetical protein